MEVGKIVLVLAINFCNIEGRLQFFADVLNCFNIENPVFITTDDLDRDFLDIGENSTTALIRYVTNEEEKEVAHHINELYFLGDLTMVVFLDNGHKKLLNLLIEDLQLFKKGLAGLISEDDVNNGLELTMQLDTKLFLYTSEENKMILKEMYAIKKSTKVKNIGTWNSSSGLSLSTTNMWERRTDMEGLTIRVASISVPSLSELRYDKSGSSIIEGEGMFLEPLNILAGKLNFTLKLMDSIDGKWGAMYENGTWNGMIGMLINNQADIAAAGLSVYKERAMVVTFSRPIAEEKLTLISTSNMGPQAQTWIYLDIFPQAAWYINFAMVIGISTCFTLINHTGINYMHDKFDSEKFTFLNGFGLSMTLLRQIYYDVNINSMSTRILFLLSAVSTYLLYVHYTAYLTALSTSTTISPITSFADVLNGGYDVSVVVNTVDHDVMRLAKPGTAMNEVYHETMKDRPSAYLKSYEEVSKMIHSKKALFYGSDFYAQALHDHLSILNIQGLSNVD